MCLPQRSKLSAIYSLMVVALLSTPSLGQKYFSGPFLDLSLNYEHVIGGSYINEVDVLSEDMRLVSALGLGYRYQFKNGIVLGGHLSRAWLDGKLDLKSPDYTVHWENNSEWYWELNAGKVFFKRFQVFAFTSEVTRKFEVDIKQNSMSYTQTDIQGMLRFGMGMEMYVFDRFNARIKVGTGRADFGNHKTNIEIRPKAHISAGLRLQLF